MQMTKLVGGLFALVLVMLSGCAVDPKYSALKPLEGADRKVDINDIRQLRQMDRTPILDPNLIGFVQRVRQRLETAWGTPCNCVVVVDSFSGYEAYSLSTTTIVVSAGLIAQASSEDEVAAVIAHELGHVYQVIPPRAASSRPPWTWSNWLAGPPEPAATRYCSVKPWMT